MLGGVDRARTDHYRVLQVDPAANPLVIQAAYRVLAQIWHPDVAGDEAEMKRINAAWEVLGDPRRRKQYDIERAGRHTGPVIAAPTPSPDTARPTVGEEHAGPPRGVPFGPVLSFGRYQGWTLGQIARVDRPFLEWLRGAPAGRAMRDEIDSVFRSAGIAGVDRRAYDLDRQRAQGAPVGARDRA
jgi:curved DNA-binding protein CbpA